MDSHALHTFHIPVMGLAFTIDSPIRVAHLGISSVISIMDDDLIEKIRAFYAGKFGFDHDSIPTSQPDYRANRITAYLNMVQKIVELRHREFKAALISNDGALGDFAAILPKKSAFRLQLERFLAAGKEMKEALAAYLENHLIPGSIDVNIMTKVDRENRDSQGLLPMMFNDAHAALRGFASSKLSSSVVLSAGMHPRLYSYMEQFADFFPDSDFHLKKKITIKVSDYRSAQVQGCFLAKKGLWVSEFRIESGLNCGGHAFATDGQLLGPILEEFKTKRESLRLMMHELLVKSLAEKNLSVPSMPFELRIAVQGGVGTNAEHEFLLQHYNVDSVGWGSPFLLVPEATSVDRETLQLLADAREEDLYTSDISPLGVPFNTVRGTTHETLRQSRAQSGKPGSSCPKKYLALSKEYDEEGICTASRKYQKRKLAEIGADPQLDERSREAARSGVLEKSCLCVGLSNSALLENGIGIKGDRSVVICPGPNIAYFDREYSLTEMAAHIYGGKSVLEDIARPHMFVKELGLYANYLRKQARLQGSAPATAKMRRNLLEGVAYYRQIFAESTMFDRSSDASIEGLEAIAESIKSVECEPVAETAP